MFNLKNLFCKSYSNYKLDYDFESIKQPLNFPLHIVVFTGGISPDPEICSSFFEKFPAPDYVIGADSGIETLSAFKKFFKKLDFSPKTILGDMDSIKNKRLLNQFSKTAGLEKFNPYKDFTDTELALILASKLKGRDTTVTLVGGSGGRIDHLIGIFDLFSSPVAPDFWLTEKQILSLLKKDHYLSLLPKSKSSPISVMRTTKSSTKGCIISKGLEWESDLFRKTCVASLSNVINQTSFENKIPIELRAKNADFIVSFDYDTGFCLVK